jgi:hypothetical protein
MGGKTKQKDKDRKIGDRKIKTLRVLGVEFSYSLLAGGLGGSIPSLRKRQRQLKGGNLGCVLCPASFYVRPGEGPKP